MHALLLKQNFASLPSDRVRALADSITEAWTPFTDEERADLLVLINRERGLLDQPTIEKMLAATNGNIGVAAKNFGICRRTLQNRMREFDMPKGKPGLRRK
jgi:DNA-binding protein Fis